MIEELVQSQDAFFASQKTKEIRFRKHYLKKLKRELIAKEDAICDALYSDFKKPTFETLATETQLVLSELDYILNRIDLWSKPQKVGSTWANFLSTDWIYHEPYGKVLIIAPWNYPFLLTISPLIGALAAGNTVVLKPSELSPNTSKIISEIIEQVFPSDYVSVVQGGVETSTTLLSLKWEYFFFTGSSRVGKIVYKAAVEHLTPVTLELSGKNPCIVDSTAAISLAAKRIVWGKFLNAGQTCIAPDYILVHQSIKDDFVSHLKRFITKAYGKNIQDSKDFARIATEEHYQGLKTKLEGQNLLFGGKYKDEERYLEPTLVDEPELKSTLMSGETFGPILPIISFENTEDIRKYIEHFDKPLALYVFSRSKKFQKQITSQYGFGGGVINDSVMQIANKNLPFGGVGASGIGGYHGRHSFHLFSHKKAIIKKSNWIDIPIRYAPYNIPIKLVKYLKHLF